MVVVLQKRYYRYRFRNYNIKICNTLSSDIISVANFDGGIQSKNNVRNKADLCSQSNWSTKKLKIFLLWLLVLLQLQSWLLLCGIFTIFKHDVLISLYLLVLYKIRYRTEGHQSCNKEIVVKLNCITLRNTDIHIFELQMGYK